VSDEGDADPATTRELAARDGEVVIAVQPEGVLVGGNAAGVAAGVGSVFGQSGKFVQLTTESVKALKAGKTIPGSQPGVFRMMIRGADGKFLKQLQWKPTAVNPQRFMAVQMIAVQIALTSTVAQVEDSIKRVEGKVEAVLQLAEATRAGDVLGNHATVDRMVSYLEKHGSLPEAFFDSISGLGPSVSVTVEQLRNHVERTLATFTPGAPVRQRADVLHKAIQDTQLGDTLSLLVVAEEALYKW